MKKLLSVTTLFVAMMLLNSSATTSESAKASNTSLSPAALLTSAKAKRENIVGAAQTQPPSIEVALVANAQAATVVLVDVASRSILGAVDVNPARTKREGPGAPNYA